MFITHGEGSDRHVWRSVRGGTTKSEKKPDLTTIIFYWSLCNLRYIILAGSEQSDPRTYYRNSLLVGRLDLKRVIWWYTYSLLEENINSIWTKINIVINTDKIIRYTYYISRSKRRGRPESVTKYSGFFITSICSPKPEWDLTNKRNKITTRLTVILHFHFFDRISSKKR